uniref:Tetraspanin-15 n=1 Tax=Varanus komodoensis TaxID=61221 RepID=A0A8D2JCZ6_VARKO
MPWKQRGLFHFAQRFLHWTRSFPSLQIIGLVILCVGIYAEVERQAHRTLEGLFLAPAVILLLLGITMFAVSFIGMVGSLRDNRMLLKTFFWVLLAILVMELLLLLIEILFEKQVSMFHSSIQDGIRHYYDDLDFKNILDFVQQKLSCCGGDDFRDWHVNPYHSCNGSSPLACGVPYTCCIQKLVNTGGERLSRVGRAAHVAQRGALQRWGSSFLQWGVSETIEPAFLAEHATDAGMGEASSRLRAGSIPFTPSTQCP